MANMIIAAIKIATRVCFGINPPGLIKTLSTYRRPGRCEIRVETDSTVGLPLRRAGETYLALRISAGTCGGAKKSTQWAYDPDSKKVPPFKRRSRASIKSSAARDLTTYPCAPDLRTD